MANIYFMTYETIAYRDGIDGDKVPEHVGATDRLLLCTMMDTNEGPSFSFQSFDGRTGGERLPPEMIFQAWAMLADGLGDELPPGPQRDLCREAFKKFQAGLAGDVVAKTAVDGKAF